MRRLPGRSAEPPPTAPSIGNRSDTTGSSVDWTAPAGSGGTPPLSYSFSGLPSGLSSSGRTVTGSPSSSGSFTVTYTVSDSAGLSDAETFTWTISDPDLLPSAPNIGNRSNLVGDTVSWLVPAGSGGDPPLTYAMTGLPAGLTFGTGTSRVTGSPTTAQMRTVTYTVTDQDGDTDSDTFVWEITEPPNPVPSFGTYEDRANVVGTEISDVTLPAATGGDPPLTYSIAGLPAGLTFNTGTRIVSGTPTTDSINTVTLTARDTGGDEADLVFTWTITTPPPTAPSLSNRTTTQGTSVGVTLPVGTGGATPLSYSISGLPAGLSFNSGSRRVSGTPTTAQTRTVTYTVTGANGLSNSETFTWTIIAPDPLPSAPDIATERTSRATPSTGSFRPGPASILRSLT